MADQPVEVEQPKPAALTNPKIAVMATEDGKVVLRIDIYMQAHEAVKLGRVLVKAAQAVLARKPIIIPGGLA